MATYIISDIHGEYRLLCRLLQKVCFSAQDTLLVAGDMIDKGPDSIKVIQLLRNMPNAFCIIGNHEYDFIKYYHGLMQTESTDFDAILKKLKEYFPDGENLTWDDIDWIETLPFYLEFENFVVTHSGWPQDAYGNMVPLEKAAPEMFVYNRLFKEPKFLPQGYKCVIFGHTPVRNIYNCDDIQFYPRTTALKHSTNIADYCKIHIDTGVYLSGILGCIEINVLDVTTVKK